jgi:hypothetical protein
MQLVVEPQSVAHVVGLAVSRNLKQAYLPKVRACNAVFHVDPDDFALV